jgi:sugar (pentulose or hexulose) kinase
MHILRDENVVIDKMYGHGGYFKTEGVGQRYLAAAIGAPVTVMKTAGEGGAWGMALLAEYMNHAGEKTLEDFLENDIFSKAAGSSFAPDPADVDGFKKYQKWFEKALPVEEAAVQSAK